MSKVEKASQKAKEYLKTICEKHNCDGLLCQFHKDEKQSSMNSYCRRIYQAFRDGVLSVNKTE